MYPLAEESLTSRINRYPLWEMAFRPGFLLAAAWSIVIQFIWLNGLSGQHSLLDHMPGNPLFWYMHEFFFGFVATVALSFLLTIAERWSGHRSMNGIVLIVFFVLWATVRVGLLFPNVIGVEVAAGASLLWWLMGIFVFWRLIERGGSTKNRIFIPILLCLMFLDLGMLAMILNKLNSLMPVYSGAAALMVGVLICVMGGRMIPAFTERSIDGFESYMPKWLDPLLLQVSVCGAIVYILSNVWPLGLVPGVLIFATGILHLVRLAFWWHPGVLKHPFLWALHLANAMLGLGLMLLGASYFTPMISFSTALHVIAIGSVGAMILAVMSRVSLDMTGRDQEVSWLMVLAFCLVIFSAFSRLGLELLGLPFAAWTISGVSWMVAFSLFIICYTPILFGPKMEAARIR